MEGKSLFVKLEGEGGLERLPGWFVPFKLNSAMSKNKEARVPFHKPQNCIFDAYSHCYKNGCLIFSFLTSWCPSERRK